MEPNMINKNSFVRCLAIAALVSLTGCGTIGTLGKLENGAGAEANRMWSRWIEVDGDIAAVTTWERKVKPGVTVKDIEEILRQVSSEKNMRDVGVLPLSKELAARSGKKEKLLTIYSFCTPSTARTMTDFSPHMAAYMPCRISLVEHDDGSLWLYTLNMDMMVKMGRKLPSPLKEEAIKVRDTMWEMMERASKGEI